MCRIKVSVFHCGNTLMSPSLPYNRGDFLFANGFAVPEKNKVWLPASAYLIEHPKGNILIDTGWGRNVSPTGFGLIRRGINRVIPVNSLISLEGKVESRKAINEQLAARGIMPEDIDYVVLSHLGPDRVSGVAGMRGARNILVSDVEYEAASHFGARLFRYQPKMWKSVPLKTFSFSETGVGPFGRSYDLFGDNSVQLVHLPGFTKGLTGVVLRNGEKFMLFFSDAGFGKDAWRYMRLPGLCADRKLAYSSLMWVRQMMISPNCVAGFANHDPEVIPGNLVF